MHHRARHVAGQDCGPAPKAQTVAARAHELWVSCGEPVVQDDSVWREAERELLTERKPNYGSAAPYPRRLH